MFLADFHVHSDFSDGKIPIPEVVDLFGKRGFGCIAITDHLCEQTSVLGRASSYLGCSLTEATLPLYRAILESEAKRAWDMYRMVVIPGLEITKNSLLNHRSAHVVALGVTSRLPAEADIPEVCRAIRAEGGLAIAAHPVWTRKIEKQTYHLWDRRKELEQCFDAWEVASGPYIFDEVQKANLPKIANSDMHVARQMTSWKTVLHCERHPEAILEAVKKQEIGFRFYEDRVVEHNLGGNHGLTRRPPFPGMGHCPGDHGLGNVALA